MSTPEPLRPIKDVWLRPRRVFRQLAAQPIGVPDYLLAAIQGIANSLMVSRSTLAGPGTGPSPSAEEILRSAFIMGPLGGIFSLFVLAALYARLGKRAGGHAARNQVIHVLAYGGIPVAASLLLSAFTALIIGEPAITNAPGADIDGFVAFMLRTQLLSYVMLQLWSALLQVMGFSEIFGLTVRKAFAVWVLGQLLGLLAVFFLSILINLLLPGLAPSAH